METRTINSIRKMFDLSLAEGRKPDNYLGSLAALQEAVKLIGLEAGQAHSSPDPDESNQFCRQLELLIADWWNESCR
jgi:hypothetical protein